VTAPYVAVVGAGLATPELDDVAAEVGRLLAAAGAVVVTGGMTGVMEAASRGAKEAGGTTVGILPTSDRAAANDYVDVAIATGMGEMRNTLVVRSADAVIAVGGEVGTLSEIAIALKIGTPVIGLKTWDLSALRPVEGLTVADSPRAAVEAALRLIS
jgi:hypothetical protein